MGHADHVNHNLGDMDLVDDAIIGDSNAVCIHSSLDSRGPNRNWIFDQRGNDVLDPCTQRGGNRLDFFGDRSVNKKPIVCS